MIRGSKISTLCIVVAASFVMLSGCGTDRLHNKSKNDSDLESLNQAQRIAGNVGASKPFEILIYYTAESAPEGEELHNIELIESRFGKFPELKSVVASLKVDRDLFPKAVDKQVKDLQAKICGTPNKGLIIFTNRNLRGPAGAKAIPYCKPGSAPETIDLSKSFQELAKAQPAVQGSLFAKANPTTLAAVFNWALSQTNAIFPSDKHSYVLVTKSHGSGGYLLTPKLTMLNSEVLEDEIIQLRGAQLWKTFMYFADFFLNKPAFGSNVDKPLTRFQRLSQLDKTGQDKVGQDKVGQDKVGQDKVGQDKVGQDKVGQDKVGQDKTGQDKTGQSGILENSIGISKDAYTTILKAHPEMQFSVIFMDACKSYLPDNIVESLKKDAGKSNIGDIYTSDEDGLPYDLLDYSVMDFRRARMSDVIFNGLKDKVGK